MKKPIKTPWSRALVAVVGLGFFSSGAAGCSTIFTTPPPCTCHCGCSNGQDGFCESTTDASGTPACEKDCNKIGTPQIACHDSSVVPTPPRTTTPACPPPEVLVTYAYCETCTTSPLAEKQLAVTACTKDDADAQANRFALADGEDCSAELCTGN